MLYDALGAILRAAAETLYRDVRPHVDDERARTQLDAMAALASDVGAMWEGLFAGLERHDAILADALREDVDGDDPLARHHALVAALNARVAELQSAGTDEARAERARLRTAMAAAAEVEQAVVERVAAAPSLGPARRM